ncbi:MAG: DnaJ C-terminal domain-containing protein, partial [Anaerolineae bacterium]
RRLARRHHPDVNPGDADAQERFKEINEAYEVLSDPEKRSKFDQFGAQWRQWEQGGGDPSQFWQQWFGGQAPGAGVRVEYRDLGDLFGAGTQSPFSEFFNALFGGMASTGGQSFRTRRAPRSMRRDEEHPVEITLEEAYRGSTRTISRGTQRLEVKIPAGVATGSRVRMRGQGTPAVQGGPPSDLYLRVRVRPDPRFERKDDDLHTEVRLDLYTAVLGGEVEVPTLTGTVLLTIPPGTASGRSFRLKGKGMPRLKDPTQQGHLYARVEIQIPSDLSPEEKELFHQLSRLKREK